MKHKKVVAMLLAGGQGSRLGELTKTMAKPAVPFGGKYRIIDFPLSNCTNSAIDTVGVLTQYEPMELNAYIGTGQPWDLDRNDGGVFVLPPYVSSSSERWYSGTADAIFQNMAFIERYEPNYVLILSGDHIYKMDYSKMLAFHEQKNADATIAVLTVPMEEASRFGIMNIDEDRFITGFEEKPAHPKSDQASMGIYIFNWQVLRDYLILDSKLSSSAHDFGKNVIPAMLNDGKKMTAWGFDGYWKDVGTIQSLYEANMDLLGSSPRFNLYDKEWRIYSKSTVMPPHFIGSDAQVLNSIVNEGCAVDGNVNHSLLYSGVTVKEGAVIEDSIIMPNAVIESGATVKHSIVGEGAIVMKNAVIGCEPEDGEVYDTKLTGDIALIASSIVIPEGTHVPKGKVIEGRRTYVK